jgi:hypothetical protein
MEEGAKGIQAKIHAFSYSDLAILERILLGSSRLSRKHIPLTKDGSLPVPPQNSDFIADHHS